MEDLNYLARLDTVGAPADFDERLKGRLEIRRQTRRRQRVLGLSLAGATAAFLACFGLLNVFVLRQDLPSGTAGLEQGRASAGAAGAATAGLEETIPVLETLDYFNRARPGAAKAETIYLLEQISYTPQSGIKY